MKEHDWIALVKNEITRALEARRGGNEGKARVCARRAAGYVVDEYLRRKGILLAGSSALVRMRKLRTLPEISPPILGLIDHFLVHVTPDHELPVDTDLIRDAGILAKQLLNEEI